MALSRHGTRVFTSTVPQLTRFNICSGGKVLFGVTEQGRSVKGRKKTLLLECAGKLTTAGEVVCAEQQRRRAVARVSPCGVAAGVRAATILKFTFINI